MKTSKRLLDVLLGLWLLLSTVSLSYGLTLTSGTLLPNDSFQMTLTGAPGENVLVEWSTNLGANAWSSLSSVSLPAGGSTNLVDSAAASFAWRFYRASDGATRASNSVGYYKLSLPPGFSLIGNEMKLANTHLSAILPKLPAGSQVYKFATGRWAYISMFDEFDNTWSPDLTIAYGEAVIVRNNATNNITIRFAGDVPQGTITNTAPAGFSVRACSPIPTVCGPCYFPGVPGDQIYKLTNPGLHPGYFISTFDEFDLVWAPAIYCAVGDGVFMRTSSPRTWTITYSVWP